MTVKFDDQIIFIYMKQKFTITFNHTWRETEWFDSEWEKTLTINNIDDER